MDRRCVWLVPWINNNTSVIWKYNDYGLISVVTLESPRISWKQLALQMCIVVSSLAEKIDRKPEKKKKKKNQTDAHIQMQRDRHGHTVSHICFRRFVDFYGSNNQLIARIHLLSSPRNINIWILEKLKGIQTKSYYHSNRNEEMKQKQHKGIQIRTRTNC